MIIAKPNISIARITIETESPLMLASGKSLEGTDNQIIRDVNGLPTIAATSITGVLRNLARNVFSENEVNELFGYQSKDGGKSSDIFVSNAIVHNANNQVLEGLLPATQHDKIIDLLRQDVPVFRDRVSLNQRGVSKNKFDNVVCPKGARFTFELKLITNEPHQSEWNTLLNLLTHPQFRLGSGSRNGLGKISCVNIKAGSFDLTQPDQSKLFKKLDNRLSAKNDALKEIEICQPSPALINADLTINQSLRIGNGVKGFCKQVLVDKVSYCYSEKVIVWQSNNQADIEYKIVIPGSSIKGAISHRALFHYRCANDIFVDENDEGFNYESLSDFMSIADRREQGLTKLLGTVDESDNSAQAGRLIFEDVYITPKEENFSIRTHNAIDRFTQGTINSALFTEELLWKDKINFDIHFIPRIKAALETEGQHQIPESALNALYAACSELADGKLPLGAGTTKGQGFLSGTLTINQDVIPVGQLSN